MDEDKNTPSTGRSGTDRSGTDPTFAFDQPGDVVSAHDLTKKEKIEILAQWEEDALSLQKATDEGMVGGERSRLYEVKIAQSQLGVINAH